ncbi:MAG TPA: O-antigen ligase family protein [Thermoanaerobaculia bacterium]
MSPQSSVLGPQKGTQSEARGPRPEDSRLELATLLLLSPLFLFPPTGRLFLTPILLLPLPWLISLAKGGEPLPRTALNGSIFVLLLMVGVSLYATYDVLFSASKVLGVVFGIAVFFAIARSARLNLALDLFVLAGAALAALGILGTNWMSKWPAVARVTSHLPAVIRGVPGQSEGFQPNAIAGALVMFVPLQFALAIKASGWRRIAYAAMFLFTAGTLLLTQSRGGYLSIAIAFAAWGIWSGKRSRVVTIALILLVLAAAIPLRHRLSTGAGFTSDVEGRTELWSRAITMIGDFPFTGIGMNTFRKIMPVMYPAFLTPPSYDIAHAHNHLLQAALDLGVPGLIAYLALWFGAAALLFSGYRKARAQRTIAGGMAAGMLAYFLFGTVDAIALGAKVGIFFWVALGLIVAMYRDAELTA